MEEVAGKTPWIEITGFHCSRLWPDYLHIVDLALAPEAAASAAQLPWQRLWAVPRTLNARKEP